MQIRKFNIEAVCFDEFMGDTVAERFEGLYCKLVELSNILLMQDLYKNKEPKEVKGLDQLVEKFDETDNLLFYGKELPEFTIFASKELAEVFKASIIYMKKPREPLFTKSGLEYVGEFPVTDREWRLFIDPGLWASELVIEYNAKGSAWPSYARLTIDSIDKVKNE